MQVVDYLTRRWPMARRAFPKVLTSSSFKHFRNKYNCQHLGILWLPTFWTIIIASTWQKYDCQHFVYLSAFRKIFVSISESYHFQHLGRFSCQHFTKYSCQHFLYLSAYRNNLFVSMLERYNCQHLGNYNCQNSGKWWLSAFREIIIAVFLENYDCQHFAEV